MLHIGVVTRHDDFHAHVIKQLLEEQGARCSLLFADSLSCVGNLSWSVWPGSSASDHGTLCESDGCVVAPRDFDVIWWRRLTGEPRIPVKVDSDDVRAVIANDCQAALLGLLLTEFEGSWVSPPEATRQASNKLVQLRAARAAGLKIPPTLVSQDPSAVRRFFASTAGQVIVKPVAGAQDTALATGRVSAEMLEDEAIRVCPAIYQAYVPGTRHLRISCFGEHLISAALDTDALDWRYPLDAHVTRYELGDKTAQAIRRVIAMLGLRMGMIDMKIDALGDPVWLEINPQGQFMFLEGMCESLHISHAFRDFLLAEARVASQRRATAAQSAAAA